MHQYRSCKLKKNEEEKGDITTKLIESENELIKTKIRLLTLQKEQIDKEIQILKEK
jgi:hypothetical protein